MTSVERRMAAKHKRDYFSELPQPPAPKAVSVVIDDSYLRGLERYIDGLGKHVQTIQDEELKVTKQFSDKLQEIAKMEDWSKRSKKEEETRSNFLSKMHHVKERRKQYREMLYDAIQERRKLWDSMQIQKDDEDILRKKMNKLGALPETEKAKHQRKAAVRDMFSLLFLISQVGLIVLFATCTKYLDNPTGANLVGTENRVDNTYSFYIHIALWIFVGLGLLMSYLKKLGYSGLGQVFMITCLAIQWTILVQGFFEQAGKVHNFSDLKWDRIPLGIDDLVHGVYGSTCVLVGLGAVLGKSTPTQQVLFALYLLPFYGLNRFIGSSLLHVSDLGGSMYIFLFGSIFGLVYAFGSGKDKSRNHDDKDSRYDSDIFALLGTAFQWVLWPSFNAVFSPDQTQYRVIVNTVLSLCASTVFSFLFSRTFRGGKFKMFDVQRASIAGGIGISSCSAFLVGPGGALAIGAVSGGMSTIGVVHISHQMGKAHKNFHDTMGVMATYTIPGLIGAISGIVSAAISTDRDDIYGATYTSLFPDNGTSQAAYQLAFLLITIGIAFIAAFPLGKLMKRISPSRHLYSDERDWEVPNDFESFTDVVEDLEMVEHHKSVPAKKP